MCRKNFVILALCSVLGVCVGQIVQNGQCDPNIPLVEDFMFGRVRLLFYNLLEI